MQPNTKYKLLFQEREVKQISLCCLLTTQNIRIEEDIYTHFTWYNEKDLVIIKIKIFFFFQHTSLVPYEEEKVIVLYELTFMTKKSKREL